MVPNGLNQLFTLHLSISVFLNNPDLKHALSVCHVGHGIGQNLDVEAARV